MLRSTRRLLVFASLLTLALNIAEPLIAGQYGKARSNSVGPLLLIGWAEVGPRLLHAMQTIETGRHLAETQAPDSPPPPVAQRRPSTTPSAFEPMRDGTTATRSPSREARNQDLLHRARAEDVLH